MKGVSLTRLPVWQARGCAGRGGFGQHGHRQVRGGKRLGCASHPPGLLNFLTTQTHTRSIPAHVPPSFHPSIPPTGTRIQTAAKQMKELMDKKFSGPWQVAIGEGFGFDISHTQHNMVYIFYNSVGILCFKI